LNKNSKPQQQTFIIPEQSWNRLLERACEAFPGRIKQSPQILEFLTYPRGHKVAKRGIRILYTFVKKCTEFEF